MRHLIDRLQRLDVLVLDDSRFMRELLKDLLRSFWVPPPREAADVATALAALAQAPPDLILADWEMPPPDGLSFVRTLRGLPDPRLRRIPVLMVTAHTEQWRINAARDAGVTEFLAKPISSGALADRIQAILDQPRPFVQSRAFRGPCRRRNPRIFAGPERRVPTAAAGEPPDLDDLRAAWLAFRALPTAREAAARLYRAAHTLRGEGTSHGYPLVTGVAASLCRSLERGHARHRVGWPTVEAHVAALNAITQERLSGGGGAAGQALLLALRDRVEEGTATMRTVGLLPAAPG
jgi:CheY-like chemotaxis protein